MANNTQIQIDVDALKDCLKIEHLEKDNKDDEQKVVSVNQSTNGHLTVSPDAATEQINSSFEFKSLEKVLQFPLVKDTCDWILGLPYLQTIRLLSSPALETIKPALAVGRMKLDEAGFKDTIEKMIMVSATVDNAALNFLDLLESNSSPLHSWNMAL